MGTCTINNTQSLQTPKHHGNQKQAMRKLKKWYIQDGILCTPLQFREEYSDHNVRKKFALYWKGQDNNDKYIRKIDWETIKKQAFTPQEYVELKSWRIWKLMRVVVSEKSLKRGKAGTPRLQLNRSESMSGSESNESNEWSESVIPALEIITGNTVSASIKPSTPNTPSSTPRTPPKRRGSKVSLEEIQKIAQVEDDWF